MLILTELQPLDFGDFAVGGAGEVIIDPVTGTRTATGLITLVGNGGRPGIIEATVTTTGDCSGRPVAITLPRTATLADALGNTFTLSAWTSSPADGVGTLGAANAPLLVYVGATATLATGQVANPYTGVYSVKLSF